MTSIKLIWVTPDAEKIILYIARVSSDQSNEDTKLLGYLIRNKHWSPFEMASMCVEIRTSRAIAQQILRHRSFHFQEFSQRYAEVAGYEDAVARIKGLSNRQSSLKCDDPELIQWWDNAYTQHCDRAFTVYRSALDKGIAPEVARFLLPLSATTRLYMAGTIRSWIHYLDSRTEEHTQQEHRNIANEIAVIFTNLFPVISKALSPD